MDEQRYPFFIEIYKGEGRILIDPFIDHIGGYRVEAGSFVVIENMEDYTVISNSLLKMRNVIENSSISRITPKEREREMVWKKNSKYKSWISFWKNNNLAVFEFFQDGHYEVYSAKHSEKHKGHYGDIIKKIELSSNATTEELGKAVIEVFKAAEEYHKDKPAYDPYPSKKLALLDDSTLTIKHPKDKHFNDDADSGAAEIYQCYSYLPKEDAESSAEFFIGTAFELDCDLASADIRESWEEFYGKTDFFEIQECNYGIYKLRAEMRNKETHKISYFLQIDEDSILECGMDVHQPNRRKKLDERLVELFQEFTLNCKR